MPYPQALNHPKVKVNESDDHLLEAFQKVTITILFIDVMKHIPTCAKFIKGICTLHRNPKRIQLSETVSLIMMNYLPIKKRDPRDRMIISEIGGMMVAYDPRRHQGMTLRRRRSRHPRASSPLNRRRRRMSSFTTPSEDFITPRHISPGSRVRGVIFSVFSFTMNFISPHVFKRAFAYLLLSLLGLWVGSLLFGTLVVRPFLFVNL